MTSSAVGVAGLIETLHQTLTVDGRDFVVTIRVTDRKVDVPYGRLMAPAFPDAIRSVAGYCEIYQRLRMVWDSAKHAEVPDPADTSSGLWFAYHESDGGSSRSLGYERREWAIESLLTTVSNYAQFWATKVAWKENGDRTTGDRLGGTSRVIRCNGTHYTIGAEPASINYRNRDGLGHAGHEFRFRLLATGEEITSHNVWYQGKIPAEFTELLPDNAELLRSM